MSTPDPDVLAATLAGLEAIPDDGIEADRQRLRDWRAEEVRRLLGE